MSHILAFVAGLMIGFWYKRRKKFKAKVPLIPRESLVRLGPADREMLKEKVKQAEKNMRNRLNDDYNRDCKAFFELVKKEISLPVDPVYKHKAKPPRPRVIHDDIPENTPISEIK